MSDVPEPITADLELIKPETRQQIDAWISKFPPGRQRSALLPALRLLQTQNGGWLSLELLDAAADYLNLPKIAVYEVASFYSMYDLKPVGRHKIAVCNSISCFLRGSEKILHHLENRLGIKPGETTDDGRFTLKEVECLAACVHAPMLQVDEQQYHENLTVEKVDALLANLCQKETGRG